MTRSGVLLALAAACAAATDDLCTTFSTACRADLGVPVCAAEDCDAVEGTLFTSEADDGRYFELALDSADVTGAVEIAVTSVYGDVDIYVTDDGSMPTRFNYQFSAATTAVRDVLVIDADTLAAGGWTYNVLVRATRASKFQVVVSDDDDAIVLSDGLPQRDTVEADAYTYFEFTLTEEMLVPDEELYVSLAVISGEPDLLLSTVREFPQMTDDADETLISVRRGGDYLSVADADAATYHVGVYGEDEATFVVTVQYAAEELLLDAVPQETFLYGILSQQAFQYEVGPALPDVSVTARPDNGQVYLYVGTADTEPATENAKWASEHIFGDQSISITADDADYPADDGTFWILVVEVCCFITDVGVSVQATSSLSATTLVQGSPVSGSVAEAEYSYFSLTTAADNTDDIVFQLTPLSGDPDLYVGCVFDPTGDADGYPSNQAGHYNFSSWSSVTDSIVISADDALRCPNGLTYAAVYGFYASSFTLTASADWTVTELSDGYPQTGYVEQDEYAQYNYRLPDDVDEVTITLTSSYGDADLYVTIDGTTPSRTNFEFFSMGASADDVVTIDEADLCDPGCDVAVAVYGWYASGYSISAQGYSSQLLQDGESMSSSVEAGSMKLFRFQVDDASEQYDLVVALTPLSGDTDLYFGTTYDSADDLVLVSSEDGSEMESYSLAAAAAGTYYIGVKGVTGASFTLLAHLADSDVQITRLTRGSPLSSTVEQHDYTYYKLYMGAGDHELVVTATPLSGNVDIVVNQCPSVELCEASGDTYLPTTDSYDFAARDSLSREVVDISFSSEDDVTEFLIGVYGIDDSSFSLYAYLLDDITTVQENIPLTSSVEKGEYMTFRYPLSVEHEDVVISVTPFSGDPDLYVATEPIIRPNATDYVWRSKHVSGDIVVVEYGDPDACVDCDIYISVYGYSASDFALLVELHSDVPTTLVDGQPQVGFLNQSVTNQYVLRTTNAGEDVEITVTPYSGDPDLYVTLDGSKPDEDNYMFRSRLWGEDRVYIDHTDEDFQANCMADGGCDVRVAVAAFAETTYSLVATTSYQATTLQLGVPHDGTVAEDSYEFYDVEIPVESSVTVKLTQQSGAAGLYIGCDNEFANKTDATWFTERVYDSQSMYVSKDELAAAGCEAPLTLNVAVYGLALSTYTLVVTEPSSVVLLSQGSSQSDALAYNAMAYYLVHVSSEGEPITVSVTNTAGWVNLYATSSDEYIPEYDADADAVLCDGGSCAYETTSDKTSFTAEGCSSCYWVIAAIGLGSSSGSNEYTLLAAAEDTVTVLQSGVPTAGAVTQGGWQYYRVSVGSATADLTVSITVYTGDPDLYISVDSEPTKDDYWWMAAYYGPDTLLVPASSLTEACEPTATEPCDFVVGVYGDQNSTYSLTAQVLDGWANPITLVPGEPQNGYVNLSTMAYFQVAVEQDAEEMRVTLSALDGGDQDLFISLDGEQPTTSHHDYASYSVFADDEIVMTPIQDGCGDPCVAYVGVYGWTAGQFTLVASSAMIKLQSSVSQYSTVAKDEYVYFGIDMPAGSDLAAVTVSLAVYSGNADLYVTTSDGHDWPTFLDYLWKSQLTGDDSVSVDYSDADYCTDCTYYVGVRGRSDSTFTVTATVEDAPEVRLKAGTPQDVTLASEGDEAYFVLFLGSTDEDVSFSLTTSGGAADMYIKADAEDACDPDDDTTYDYTTYGSSSTTVDVPADYEQEGDNPFFRVTVRAWASNTVFTLVAATSQTPITLQSGASVRQYVAEGGLEVFAFDMSSALLDLVITVTALYGDADLFVSAGDDPPYLTDAGGVEGYQWLSFYTGDETLTIDHTDPCGDSHHATTGCDPDLFRDGGTIYIGVFGFTDSGFSVMARQQDDHVELVTGEPQKMTTSASVGCASRDDFGGCESDEEDVQVSLALFRVTTEDLEDDMSITITAQPSCNSTEELPGCEGNPAWMFVQSCNSGACSADDMYPTPLNTASYAQERALDADRSSIFIAHDPLNPATGFCDTSLGECLYYVAVYSPDPDTAVEFTLSAALPNDVTLLPTGELVSWGPDVTTASTGKNYDAYVVKGETVHIELDVCQGAPELYVCDDSCDTVKPSPDDFRWHAKPGFLCEWTDDDCVDIGTTVPLFSALEAEVDSYFLGVFGAGVYQLNIATGDDSHYLSASSEVIVSEVDETTATVEWDAAALVDGDGDTTAASATYLVYAIRTDALQDDVVLTTACGLDTAQSVSGGVDVVTVTDGSYKAQLTGLAAGVEYTFNVAAVCDSVCLFKATGVTASDSSVSTAFSAVAATTAGGESSGEGGKVFGISAGYVIGIGVAAGVLLVALVGYARHRRNTWLKSRSQYETQELTRGGKGRSLLTGRRSHKYSKVSGGDEFGEESGGEDDEVEVVF